MSEEACYDVAIGGGKAPWFTNVLQSYITDSFYWVDDRTTAEDLASRYLDMVEEYVGLISEHAAQVTEDYAALQKELEEIQKITEENE